MANPLRQKKKNQPTLDSTLVRQISSWKWHRSLGAENSTATIHIAMTLDATYIRGSVTDVLSVLHDLIFCLSPRPSLPPSAASSTPASWSDDVDAVEHRWNQHGLGRFDSDQSCGVERIPMLKLCD